GTAAGSCSPPAIRRACCRCTWPSPPPRDRQEPSSTPATTSSPCPRSAATSVRSTMCGPGTCTEAVRTRTWPNPCAPSSTTSQPATNRSRISSSPITGGPVRPRAGGCARSAMPTATTRHCSSPKHRARSRPPCPWMTMSSRTSTPRSSTTSSTGRGWAEPTVGAHAPGAREYGSADLVGQAFDHLGAGQGGQRRTGEQDLRPADAGADDELPSLGDTGADEHPVVLRQTERTDAAVPHPGLGHCPIERQERGFADVEELLDAHVDIRTGVREHHARRDPLLTGSGPGHEHAVRRGRRAQIRGVEQGCGIGDLRIDGEDLDL